MISDVQPGDRVVEVATGAEWTILYFDKELRFATCERAKGHRNIVRAMRTDELKQRDSGL